MCVSVPPLIKSRHAFCTHTQCIRCKSTNLAGIACITQAALFRIFLEPTAQATSLFIIESMAAILRARQWLAITLKPCAVCLQNVVGIPFFWPTENGAFLGPRWENRRRERGAERRESRESPGRRMSDGPERTGAATNHHHHHYSNISSRGWLVETASGEALCGNKWKSIRSF